MNQQLLKPLIRARMLRGTLPSSGEHRLYCGAGDGVSCTCCGTLISAAQVQYDVEIPTAYGKTVSLAMHILCYSAWRTECGRARANVG